jgi:hypothetical protein
VDTRIGVSGCDSTRLGGWINSSRHDSSRLGGIVVSGHESGRLEACGCIRGGSEHDSGRLRGGIVVSRSDSSRLGGRIVVSGRDSGGLGGIVALRHDSGRLRGGIVALGHNSTRLIEGFRRVDRTRLLDYILGSNSCKAFLFFDLAVLAQHVLQVARTLLAGLEASLRNTKSGSFLMQAEQYFESILEV